MTENKQTALDYSLITSFKRALSICNAELNSLKLTAPLTTANMQSVQTIQLCMTHMNRLCNTFEYITSPEIATKYIEVLEDPGNSRIQLPEKATPEFLRKFDELNSTRKQLQNIDVCNLLEQLCKKFLDTISNFCSVKINYYSKLKKPQSVFIFKHRFELMILNILYCCIKNAITKQIKLDIYVTECKNDIVFHIRDNNENLSADIEAAVFGTKTPNCNAESSELVFESMTALSLALAKKVAAELNIAIKYTPLKSGNRFDIFIPKMKNLPSYSFCSLTPYRPTPEIYTRVFADFQLQAMLQKLIDSFGKNEGDWLW